MRDSGSNGVRTRDQYARPLLVERSWEPRGLPTLPKTCYPTIRNRTATILAKSLENSRSWLTLLLLSSMTMLRPTPEIRPIALQWELHIRMMWLPLESDDGRDLMGLWPWWCPRNQCTMMEPARLPFNAFMMKLYEKDSTLIFLTRALGSTMKVSPIRKVPLLRSLLVMDRPEPLPWSGKVQKNPPVEILETQAMAAVMEALSP
jgi:hypothetical protein